MPLRKVTQTPHTMDNKEDYEFSAVLYNDLPDKQNTNTFSSSLNTKPIWKAPESWDTGTPQHSRSSSWPMRSSSLPSTVVGTTTLYENGKTRFIPTPTPDPKGTSISCRAISS